MTIKDGDKGTEQKLSHLEQTVKRRGERKWPDGPSAAENPAEDASGPTARPSRPRRGRRGTEEAGCAGHWCGQNRGTLAFSQGAGYGGRGPRGRAAGRGIAPYL